MNNAPLRWPEERIRQELARLDAQTGLHGNALPIVFTRAKRVMGYFQANPDGSPRRFGFSKLYLENAEFPDNEVYDTIRHEYAHYMCCMRHGNHISSTHGPEWRQCCYIVQARPCASYKADERMPTPEPCVQYPDGLAAERQAELDAFLDQLAPGTVLSHPRFGMGRVLRVDRCPKSERVELLFQGEMQPRLLSAGWVLAHCSPAPGTTQGSDAGVPHHCS